MRVGIYPGSFYPVTNGHLDIIERASKLVETLVVAVLINPAKGKGLFSIEERLQLLRKVTAHLDNVKIDTFSGLLIDYAKELEADAIIRCLRSAYDFEKELVMAQINKKLLQDVETLFLVTAPEYAYMSSSSVRELVLFGGDFTSFVPSPVVEALKNK